jgi:hypothetical protein
MIADLPKPTTLPLIETVIARKRIETVSIRRRRRNTAQKTERIAFSLTKKATAHLGRLKQISGKNRSSLMREALFQFAAQPYEYQRERLKEALLLQYDLEADLQSEQSTMTEAAITTIETLSKLFKMPYRISSPILQAAIMDMKHPDTEQLY